MHLKAKLIGDVSNIGDPNIGDISQSDDSSGPVK